MIIVTILALLLMTLFVFLYIQVRMRNHYLCISFAQQIEEKDKDMEKKEEGIVEIQENYEMDALQAQEKYNTLLIFKNLLYNKLYDARRQRDTLLTAYLEHEKNCLPTHLKTDLDEEVEEIRRQIEVEREIDGADEVATG